MVSSMFLVGLLMGMSMLVNAAPAFVNDIELDLFNATDSRLDARGMPHLSPYPL